MKLIIRVVVPRISSLPKTGPPRFCSQLSCVNCDASTESSFVKDDLYLPHQRTSSIEVYDRCVITANCSQEEADGGQHAFTEILEFSLMEDGTDRYTSVSHQEHLYKAICLSSGVTMCSSMTSEMCHPHPVARIQTNGKELIFVTQVDQRITPLDKFDLGTIGTKLAKESFPLGDNLGSVIFPLIGLKCVGSLPLREDEKYRGLLMLEQSQRKPVIVDPSLLRATVINEPFLLWAMREEQLVFAAYLDPTSWIKVPRKARRWAELPQKARVLR